MEDEGFSEIIGVNKDVESYTDIIGKQLMYINQLITGGGSQNLIENSINVLEVLLRPYLPGKYLEDIKQIERESVVKLCRIRSDDRYFKEGAIINGFLLNKYGILLKYAQERGFLPKTLKW